MNDPVEHELTAEPVSLGPADAEQRATVVTEIEAMILRIAEQRGADKSLCPTDVARALAEDWRPLLFEVRAAGRRLAEQDRIEILRHGKPIVPGAMKGVIRLRLKQP
jgi:Protein of unknown function (DUF3253)